MLSATSLIVAMGSHWVGPTLIATVTVFAGSPVAAGGTAGDPVVPVPAPPPQADTSNAAVSAVARTPAPRNLFDIRSLPFVLSE